MKLTKSERHTAYIIMLAEAENKKWYEGGFCWMIYTLFSINDKGFFIEEERPECIDRVVENFPELLNKKPFRLESIYWFDRNKDGWQKRIELLKQCIEETY